MKSTGLLLFSHGSLAPHSDASLLMHARRIRERDVFAAVEIGFLNYSRPTFDDAVHALSNAGIKRIVVAPYFLAPGYFVRSALPMTVHSAKEVYPSLEFAAAKCIDYDNRLPETLLSIARKSAAPEIDLRDSGLLALSHGSRDVKANLPIEQVTGAAAGRGAFREVRLAFLQINSPSVPEETARLIDEGVKQIVIVPYFLHMGNHAQEDLPRLLLQLRRGHPQTKLILSGIIGDSPIISDILQDRALAALRLLREQSAA